MDNYVTHLRREAGRDGGADAPARPTSAPPAIARPPGVHAAPSPGGRASPDATWLSEEEAPGSPDSTGSSGLTTGFFGAWESDDGHENGAY